MVKRFLVSSQNQVPLRNYNVFPFLVVSKKIQKASDDLSVSELMTRVHTKMSVRVTFLQNYMNFFQTRIVEQNQQEGKFSNWTVLSVVRVIILGMQLLLEFQCLSLLSIIFENVKNRIDSKKNILLFLLLWKAT